MLGQKHQLLVDTVQRLLRREAHTNIKRIFAKTHPADLAAVISRFDEAHKELLFNLIDTLEIRAEILSEMHDSEAAEFLSRKPIERIVALLREMESDDVGELLRYEEDSAGGIMTPDYIALHEDVTVHDAIGTLRESKDVDMAFYLYVVNDHEQLVGVLSLRKLVIVKPSTVLKDIMEPNVVAVKVHDDQEDVARLVSRYSLLAIPVVDENNSMQGIVTVDDVIDVIREEATEDILKMAGAGEELVGTDSVSKSVRARSPWLLVSCIGELIGVVVISPFIGELQTHHYLALFMPIIMAMGGNIGTQSATVIVRGLATGFVDQKRMATIYWRELRVAIVLGLAYGLLVGAISLLFTDSSIIYGASVAISMALAMVIAVTVGTLLPIVLARLHVDPAVSTGPFVTSAVDVLGLLIFFVVSSTLISLAGL